MPLPLSDLTFSIWHSLILLCLILYYVWLQWDYLGSMPLPLEGKSARRAWPSPPSPVFGEMFTNWGKNGHFWGYNSRVKFQFWRDYVKSTNKSRHASDPPPLLAMPGFWMQLVFHPILLPWSGSIGKQSLPTPESHPRHPESPTRRQKSSCARHNIFWFFQHQIIIQWEWIVFHLNSFIPVWLSKILCWKY